MPEIPTNLGVINGGVAWNAYKRGFVGGRGFWRKGDGRGLALMHCWLQVYTEGGGYFQTETLLDERVCWKEQEEGGDIRKRIKESELGKEKDGLGDLGFLNGEIAGRGEKDKKDKSLRGIPGWRGEGMRGGKGRGQDR